MPQKDIIFDSENKDKILFTFNEDNSFDIYNLRSADGSSLVKLYDRSTGFFKGVTSQEFHKLTSNSVEELKRIIGDIVNRNKTLEEGAIAIMLHAEAMKSVKMWYDNQGLVDYRGEVEILPRFGAKPGWMCKIRKRPIFLC